MLLVVLCATITVSAYAIEPSTQIVVRNGMKVYVHKVERGHTLYSIAKAYGVTEKQIMECNDGLSAATLRADDVIYIPCIEKKSKSNNKRSQREEPSDGDKYYIYTVKAGDTFYSIARAYKISVDILREDNPGVDPSKLSLGTELRIRRGEVGYATTDDIDRSEQSNTTRELRPNEHVVQAGETVYSLSRRAGLTEREFMALNKLRSPSDLKQGMIVLLSSDIEEPETPAEQAEQPAEPMTSPADESQATVEEQTAEDSGSDANGGDEPQPQKPRERISGRSDGDPVVDNSGFMDWFFFNGNLNDNNTFRHTTVDFYELGENNTLKVALMLPFQIEGKVKPVYVDFYRGVLLAMEDLKAEGLSIDLTVFDTRNDAREIDDIMTYEDAFLDAQLIIGPVFENELQYIISHAERESVAVVSPLANVETLQSPVLFQMQPERSHKYDKIKGLLGDDREVITIYASTNDTDFLNEVHSEVTSSRRTELVYRFDRGSFFNVRTASGGRGESVDIDELLRTRHDKTIIIVADQETDIARILTTLSSSKSKLLDRGALIGRYDVIGNYKWTRLQNVDSQSFFKNNVSFVVSYNHKRSNETIRLFDGRYVAAYNTLPTAFSYRGYDAAMIFCRGMYSGLDVNFLGESFKPLTTSYRFVPEGGINVNSEWMCERYNDDFTITTM